jgi:hypothetical protein
MTKAIIVRTNGEVVPLELQNTNQAYLAIRDAVGGNIDAVSDDKLCCYVHDEGLLIGLPVNVMVSHLFKRPLVGDAVLVGALNEEGEYDGENHDVPYYYRTNVFADFAVKAANQPQLVKHVEQLAKAVLDVGTYFQPLTNVEFDKWLDSGELPTPSI